MRIVRLNGPVVPIAICIGNAESKTAIYIRLRVAMGFAPIRQSNLVGENTSGNLRIGMSINQNKPIQFTGICIRLAPFLENSWVFLYLWRFDLNNNLSVEINGLFLLRKVDSQGCTDGNIRAAVHVFIKHKGDKTGICH